MTLRISYLTCFFILTLLTANIESHSTTPEAHNKRRLQRLGDPGVRPDPITGKPVYVGPKATVRIRVPSKSSLGASTYRRMSYMMHFKGASNLWLWTQNIYIILIAALLCIEWRSQIRKSKTWACINGLFVGYCMVEKYFLIFVSNGIYWSPHFWNFLVIFTSVMVAYGAHANQGFGYGALGWAAVTGVDWFLWTLYSLVSRQGRPSWLAFLTLGLGIVGVMLGFQAIWFAKRKPQSLVIKSVMSILSGAYFISWCVQQLLSWYGYYPTENYAWISIVVYLLYITLSTIAYCTFFKNDRVVEPFPCEIPRRYTRGKTTASKMKHNNVMPAPGAQFQQPQGQQFQQPQGQQFQQPPMVQANGVMPAYMNQQQGNVHYPPQNFNGVGLAVGTSAQPPQMEAHVEGGYANAHIGNDGGPYNPFHNEINVRVEANNTNVQVQPHMPPIQTIGISGGTIGPDTNASGNVGGQGNFNYPSQL